MQSVPREIVDNFADAYAGKKVGFSAAEITIYFKQYSNLVKAVDHYGRNPTRKQLFVDSVYSLPPKSQYYSLNDLTWRERPSKYQYPSSELRKSLREVLHNFISPDPIGLRFSQIRETAFREDWVTCSSRLQQNPAACITASRMMLETILRTIIRDRGGEPDRTGDLAKLVRQVQDILAFKRTDRNAEHQILTGFSSIINGLCATCNSAGDRAWPYRRRCNR